MTERDELDSRLQEYLASLPAERRPARDRAARRQRLLPHLRTHLTSERRRVLRRRAVARAASLIALGGVGATAIWLALPRLMARPAATTTSSASAAPPVSGSAVAPLSPAAALTVIDGAVWVRGDSGAHALRAGESVALADMSAFEAPADRPARVRVADVVAMTLAPGGRARPMVPASRNATTPGVGAGAIPSLAIALERGRAHFEVQKLHGARRFHVMTPDADVEVRGTIFDVELSPRADAPTCVSVDEGLVQVAKGMRTRLLARGESWDCGTANVSTSAPAAKVKTGRPRAVARAGGVSASPTRVEPSDLHAQNEIFQAALSAERAGRTEEATRLYRQLLARAPDGPLSAQTRANLAAMTSSGR
jgi:ferric-dicitrate binding protein FerR (iron transport regulator)